jgi:hypothetical protein
MRRDKGDLSMPYLQTDHMSMCIVVPVYKIPCSSSLLISNLPHCGHNCRLIPSVTTCQTRPSPKSNQLPASSMTSSAGLFPTQEPSKQILSNWLEQNGFHACGGVEIYESGNGWGVRAMRDIGFDELRTSALPPGTYRRRASGRADGSPQCTQNSNTLR